MEAAGQYQTAQYPSVIVYAGGVPGDGETPEETEVSDENDASSAARNVSQGGVFISHIHEDKPLADAFSLLLRDITAGALRTFSSSDNTAGGGIRYGAEWFQWIKGNLQESDHVVALLTPGSLQRPWILFEAGLGKAKPEGIVFGLALGVSVSDASVGPFGVFQNSASDETSLVKLCRQLIEPCGADPRDAILRQMIAEFNSTVEAHLKTSGDSNAEGTEESADAVFQSIEDLKFLVRQLAPAERTTSRPHGDGETVVDTLDRFGGRMPATVRLRLLAAAGVELGHSALAAMIEQVLLRKPAPRSPAVADAFYDLIMTTPPTSRASALYISMVREEFERWASGRSRDAEMLT